MRRSSRASPGVRAAGSSPAPAVGGAAGAEACAVTRGRGEGGQATVELAMLLPVVVVVLLTVVQLGLLARDRLLVAHAGREAARAAAVDPTPSAARRAAEASAGALDPAKLDVVIRAATGSGVAMGDRLQVLVTYRAQSDLPVVGSLLPDITMASEVTVRVE